LAALAGTGLGEHDEFAAVMAVLHFVRGAAALAIEAGPSDFGRFPDLLRMVVKAERFPALAAALDAGVFDAGTIDSGTDDHRAALRSGLTLLLDGIAVKIAGPGGQRSSG
jgi:hypothetical protein